VAVVHLVTTPVRYERLATGCYLDLDAIRFRPGVLEIPFDTTAMVSATPYSDLCVIEKLREQELEEARIIQGSMFPARALDEFEVAISREFQPIAEVGGDFLDYFSLADGTIGLYVGDVSGKGLPAALYAALVIGTLRGIHKTGQRPGRVLSLLNERLHLREIPAHHACIQYALFYPATGEMIISSAGMPGPFLVRGHECQAIQLAGIPTGLLAGVAYDELCLQLQPGDSVLFCSDGLTEARNKDDQEFGIDAVQELCRRHASDPPLELLANTFAAVEEFTRDCPQFDDITLTVFQYCQH
jgi:phosphoserine phosphatase RsbU/P